MGFNNNLNYRQNKISFELEKEVQLAGPHHSLRFTMKNLMLLLLLSLPLLADTAPVYGGSGCPAGTAQISQGNKGELILELSDYKIVDNTIPLSRLVCSVAWPISIPEGYAAVLGNAQIFGTLTLKMQDRAQFSGESFIPGNGSTPFVALNNQPYNGPVNYASGSQMGPSDCGQSIIARLNTSIIIEGTSGSSYQINKIVMEKPQLKRCRN